MLYVLTSQTNTFSGNTNHPLGLRLGCNYRRAGGGHGQGRDEKKEKGEEKKGRGVIIFYYLTAKWRGRGSAQQTYPASLNTYKGDELDDW